jgi:hypothetical protein
MKNISNTAILCSSIFMVMLGSFAAGALAMEKDEAPSSVTIDYLQELYTAVDFDHQMHAENYTCNTCHHHTTGDGPANDRCAKCHADSRPTGDVSCSGCHEQQETAFASPANHLQSDVYHIDKPALKGALHLQCLGCHQVEDGPTGCQDCHAFTPKGRKRFALPNKVND